MKHRLTMYVKEANVQNSIQMNRVTEGNLKDISVTIPRNGLIAITGVSGSGKSTLAIDTLYNECQRQYLEAMGFQGIQKPKLDSLSGASPAVMIGQSDQNRNPRSTVGTVTNLYTELRMLFEKLAIQSCTHCHSDIKPYEAKELVEKEHHSFKVFHICPHCNQKIEKLTRTHFSYNTREGACPTCQGMGKTMTLSPENVIHENLSLEEGGVSCWDEAYKNYQIGVLKASFKHYQLPETEKTVIKAYSPLARAILETGTSSEAVKTLAPHIKEPAQVTKGKYEGVFTMLWRRLSEKGGDYKDLEKYFQSATCPDCKGERLQVNSRQSQVNGKRLPELSQLSLQALTEWMLHLEKDKALLDKAGVRAYVEDILGKLERIAKVGLSYLSLDRQTVTLSGGELQRLRLAAILDSAMTGLIYIMDEPTAGLHPKDTAGIVELLLQIKERGNTVIVIEHDPEVMKMCDYIVDIGPGAGKHGGEVIACGVLEEIMAEPSSETGNFLKGVTTQAKSNERAISKWIETPKASLYNLKNVAVRIPHGVLTTVSGVSGSGKSTLIFEVLLPYVKENPQKYGFDQVIEIEQAPLTRMKRSNVATYMDIYTDIRKLFAKEEDAKKLLLTHKDFSFNAKGGRCEHCEGLGTVVSNMLFFKDVEVICPSCNGQRFQETVLSVTYSNLNIHEVLKLSIEEAYPIFKKTASIAKKLKLLIDVGLEYLELGQTLTTLSGGEGQRLKLAEQLLSATSKEVLYLIDEPTVGLHPKDVTHFIVLLQAMVEAGNTVVVVEHNTLVIQSSDWVIDMGPLGGEQGGDIVAFGRPMDLKDNKQSITGQYL